MKSILLNKELEVLMRAYQKDVIEGNELDNLKLRLDKLTIEVDFSLGIIEVRNAENRVCINTYENELVSIDLEAIKD